MNNNVSIVVINLKDFVKLIIENFEVDINNLIDHEIPFVFRKFIIFKIINLFSNNLHKVLKTKFASFINNDEIYTLEVLDKLNINTDLNNKYIYLNSEFERIFINRFLNIYPFSEEEDLLIDLEIDPYDLTIKISLCKIYY